MSSPITSSHSSRNRLQDVLNQTPSHAYYQYKPACEGFRWISLAPADRQSYGPQASLSFTGKGVFASTGHETNRIFCSLLGSYLTTYVLLSYQGGPFQISVDGRSYFGLGTNYSPNPQDDPRTGTCILSSVNIYNLPYGEHTVSVGGTWNCTSYFAYFEWAPY